MGYRLSGTVTIEFRDYETDEIDPVEARHEVETVPIEYLLDYAVGVTVQVDRQAVT